MSTTSRAAQLAELSRLNRMVVATRRSGPCGCDNHAVGSRRDRRGAGSDFYWQGMLDGARTLGVTGSGGGREPARRTPSSPRPCRAAAGRSPRLATSWIVMKGVGSWSAHGWYWVSWLGHCGLSGVADAIDRLPVPRAGPRKTGLAFTCQLKLTYGFPSCQRTGEGGWVAGSAIGGRGNSPAVDSRDDCSSGRAPPALPSPAEGTDRCPIRISMSLPTWRTMR
jgi:hypothetical protein